MLILVMVIINPLLLLTQHSGLTTQHFFYKSTDVKK